MADSSPRWRTALLSKGGAVLGVAAVIAAAAGLAQWQRLRRPAAAEPARTFPPLVRPQPAAEGYAGSAACRECHRDVWERYQSHPMSRSMSSALEAQPVETDRAESAFQRGNREYRVERTETAVLHHESARDAAGELIYDQAIEVDYAIGSARRGRTYVLERDGSLFASPISWYAREQRWDLSPGYQVPGHQRFERRIVDRCVSCHAGAAAPLPDAKDRFAQPPFRELSIGCERCHGPGEAHIAWRRAVEPPAEDDPIVNPSRLEAPLRESVCNQCHLHAATEILRYGRTDFDFRPGMHTGEIWSSFVAGAVAGPGGGVEAVSQVPQMRSGACYLGSDGRLGCTSCHDPHSVPAPEERVPHYRARCLSCHGEDDCLETPAARRAGTSADSCIDCHMPRLDARDVPHTSQTDHRVVRRPERQSHLPLPMPLPDMPGGQVGTQIFDQDAYLLPETDLARAQALQMIVPAERQRGVAIARHVETLLRPIWTAAPDDVAAADALAVACLLTRRGDEAVRLWQQILTSAPEQEDALMSLAFHFQRTKAWKQAIDCYDRLLAVNPWSSHFQARRARALAEAGRAAEAIAGYERAIEIDPSDPVVRAELAALCERQGDSARAQTAREAARRLRGE